MSDPGRPDDAWGVPAQPPAGASPFGPPPAAPPFAGGYGPPPVPYGQAPAPASAGIRIGAYLLSIVLSIVTLRIGYLIWSLVVWKDGTTPAYQILGLRCYEVRQQRTAGWGPMALRGLIGWGVIFGVVPFAVLVSFVLFLARSDRQGIPELISGTIVVRSR